MGTRSDVHKQFSHSKLPKPAYVNLLPFCGTFVNFIYLNLHFQYYAEKYSL